MNDKIENIRKLFRNYVNITMPKTSTDYNIFFHISDQIEKEITNLHDDLEVVKEKYFKVGYERFSHSAKEHDEREANRPKTLEELIFEKRELESKSQNTFGGGDTETLIKIDKLNTEIFKKAQENCAHSITRKDIDGQEFCERCKKILNN